MSGHQHSAECSCAHEAKEQDIDLGTSLFQAIDLLNVRALNASDVEDSKNPFKPWDKRLDDTDVLKSDEDDSDLIIFIPFTNQVIVKSFQIIGGSNTTAPSHVKIWVNREDIDFSNAGDIPCTQEFDLQYDPAGEIEYPTRINKFHNVHSILMFFDKNYDADFTQVNYIGLKGVTTLNRREIVEVVYEAQANPADHKKAKAEESSSMMM